GGSDPAISNKESGNSSELPAVEPTIRVSPRPSGVETDQFAFDRPSLGGRTAFALASVFAVALVGAAATYAWQSNRATTSPPDTAVDQASTTPAAQTAASGAAPVAQTALAPNAPATSPDLAKQLETMSQDLASVRRGIQQLTAN